MTVKNFITSSGDLDYPAILPTLDLDFANSKTLDPRITFTRSSGGSYVGPDGLIKYAGVNQPRFDHDPTTGESLGLMIEEPRSNSFQYSEQFDNSYWDKITSFIQSNVTTAPDGNITADKLIPSLTGTTGGYVVKNQTYVSGTIYTASCFAKAAEFSTFSFIFQSSAFGSAITTRFNLLNGTLGTITGSATASIQAFPNGWYRCTATATATATVSDGIQYRTGNMGNGTSGIYIWGAQLEVGTFPTSYIPTTTSTRTRNSDRVSITGTKFSSWYNQSEGTTYWNASRKYDIPSSNFPGVWNVSDSLGANAISNSFLTNTLSSFNVFSNNKQVALIYPPTKVTPLLNRKSSGAYKIKDYATSLNGSLYKSNVSGPVPIVTQLNIGGNQFGNTSNILNGTISRLTYYPKRLPDSQLQALTR
jgi:hypothetical protein